MRLKQLREEKKATQQDVANYLGVTKTCYHNYESGLREPNISVLIKLSNYYNVTIDYLIGLDNANYINELDKELFSYTSQLNDLEKAKVIGYAKSRVEQQKEDKYNQIKNKLLKG